MSSWDTLAPCGWALGVPVHPLGELSGCPRPHGRAAGPMVCLLWQAALGCRAAQVLMQYCILANHYWFLVEAVYLYKLLIGAVFSEKNYYRLYLYLGWGRGHPGMRWGQGQYPVSANWPWEDAGSADPGCPHGVPPSPGLVSQLRWVLGFTGFAV